MLLVEARIDRSVRKFGGFSSVASRVMTPGGLEPSSKGRSGYPSVSIPAGRSFSPAPQGGPGCLFTARSVSMEGASLWKAGRQKTRAFCFARVETVSYAATQHKGRNLQSQDKGPPTITTQQTHALPVSPTRGMVCHGPLNGHRGPEAVPAELDKVRLVSDGDGHIHPAIPIVLIILHRRPLKVLLPRRRRLGIPRGRWAGGTGAGT
jgi:hypothetical protein